MEAQLKRLALLAVLIVAACSDPKPVVLAGGLPSPFGLTLRMETLYWTELGTAPSSAPNGSLVKMDRRGGQPVTLATGLKNPIQVAVTSKAVYCVNTGTITGPFTPTVDGSLIRVPTDGGAITTLAAGSDLFALSSFGDDVYWASGDSLLTFSEGGTTITLANGVGPVQGITSDRDGIYWSTNDAILRVPRSGGAPTTLAAGQNGPGRLAVVGSTLVWKNANSLVKARIAGGTPTTMRGPADFSVLSFTANAQFAFVAQYTGWTEPDSSGSSHPMAEQLLKFDLGTDEGLSLPASIGVESSLAADASTLFWADKSLGQIKSLSLK